MVVVVIFILSVDIRGDKVSMNLNESTLELFLHSKTQKLNDVSLRIQLFAGLSDRKSITLEKLLPAKEQEIQYALWERDSLIGLLSASPADDGSCTFISWTGQQSVDKERYTFEDCISLKTIPHSNESFWYGGPELFDSHFVSSSGLGSSFPMQPFQSSDIFASETRLGGVLDAIWYNSNGWSISVPSSSILSQDRDDLIHVPLWTSFRDSSSKYRNSSLCFRASYQNFSKPCHHKQDSRASCPVAHLQYKICKQSDIGQMWEKTVQDIPYEPLSPNDSALESPIWSTWAEYKVFINQSAVLDFAQHIIDNNYPHSVLEIDDRWSVTYGDFTFDPIKFPNPQEMIQQLHRWNFSVMLWITPFCDVAATVYEEGLENHFFVLKDTGQKIEIPTAYPVKWWQNNSTGSAVLDVTNPAAVEWFKNRLRDVQKSLGVDGFKLDAGETVYIPPLSDPTALYFDRTVFQNNTQPLEYTRLYASIANNLGGFTEVRAAWRTQQHRNYVRIMDLDSVWGYKNGIASIIPRVLLFGTLGYRYVLPDMIGGNGYGARGDLLFRGMPTAELYIRWIQCNLLLPMQLSIPPWRYGNSGNDPLLYAQVIDAVRTVFQLRESLMEFYRTAVREAIGSSGHGLPIARPMWFADPRNPDSWKVEDQYMIGSMVVVAPILQRNGTSRTVFLPPGRWIPCSHYYSSKGKDTHSNAYMTGNNALSWKDLLSGVHGNGSDSKDGVEMKLSMVVAVVEGPRTFLLTNVSLTSPTPCFLKLSKMDLEVNDTAISRMYIHT